MELYDQAQAAGDSGEYQLTVEVITDIPTYVEVTAVEIPATQTTAEDEALFVFPSIEAPVFPELPPPGELTAFERQTIAVMLSGNFDPFDPFYVGQDGTIDTELCGDVWWGASVLRNDLTNAGIAPENFAAVAEQWLSA